MNIKKIAALFLGICMAYAAFAQSDKKELPATLLSND